MRARVSQWELGSQTPCSKLIMHNNERKIGSQSTKLRGRLAHKAQNWERDWLTKSIKTDLFFNTELLLQACINCSVAFKNVSWHYKKFKLRPFVAKINNAVFVLQRCCLRAASRKIKKCVASWPLSLSSPSIGSNSKFHSELCMFDCFAWTLFHNVYPIHDGISHLK